MANRTVSLPGVLKRALSESQNDCSDQQLLSRFADSGDETAFAAILDRHGPMLYGTCRRLLDGSHLADDVLQATFLLLARQCRSIRQRDSLAGWLYRVAQRLARQARLAETARSNRERIAATNRPMAKERDPGWDELCLVLDEELRKLPERYRVPLLLCYLEGRTQDEAAKQLGWSPRTLRRRVDRARTLLKAQMIRRGATLGAGMFAGFLAPSVANAILTPDLRLSILSSASTGVKNAAVSTAALGMVNTAMRMAMFTKIAIWSAVALAMSGAVFGMFQLSELATKDTQPIAQTPPTRPADGKAEAPPVNPATAPEAGRDQFNDRLPDGAVARLGTVAFRHGSSGSWPKSLTFTADGKHLVSMAGGSIRRWDLGTGITAVNLGDGRATEFNDAVYLVTTDGKAAYIFRRIPSRPVDKQECTEYDLESGKEKRRFRLDLPWNAVHNLTFSPDGKTCAELSGAIAVWNAADGAILHQFKLKEGTYTTLAFTPDGKSLIYGDDQHMLRVFDLTTGKEARSFGVADVEGNGRSAPVIKLACSAAVSPDGKNLATADRDDSFIRIWDLARGTVQRNCDLPKGFAVRSLAFTSDSSTLIAGAENGIRSAIRPAVYSWSVESGKPGRSWTDDPWIGTIVAVSPDDCVVATMNVFNAGIIRFWDRKTGKEKQPREASPTSLQAVCFRPDGETIRTGGDDLAVREWDTASGRSLGPPLATAKDRAMRFSADGKFLIGKKDKTVWVQDLATGKVLLEGQGSEGALSPDGKRLATTDQDGRVRIFDVETAKVVQTWLPDETETPDGPHPTPDKKKPADSKEELMKPGDGPGGGPSAGPGRPGGPRGGPGAGGPRGGPPAKTGAGGQGGRVGSDGLHPSVRGFTADGKSLILQGDIVSIWDVQTATLKSSWSLKQKMVLEEAPKERLGLVAVSPDGSKIAFDKIHGSRPGGGRVITNRRIMTLETATGKVVHQTEFDVDDSTRRQIAFSPDGNLLAASGRTTVHVWDLKTGKEVHKFDGHRGAITSLAFSPDGKRLVSASDDSTALVWDLSK